MTRMIAAGVAAALGAVMLLALPMHAAAKSGSGGGAKSFHSHSASGNRPQARHRGAFRARHERALHGGPLVAGYLAYPPYSYYGADAVGEAPLVRFVSPPEPPRVLNCQRSREAITVAAQDGGTREIKITRC
jgi:hypothetical protein